MKIIHTDPETLGGTPIFWKTRVPVHLLFEYLETGESIDTFLDEFPTVRREQVLALLKATEEMLPKNPALYNEDTAG